MDQQVLDRLADIGIWLDALWTDLLARSGMEFYRVETAVAGAAVLLLGGYLVLARRRARAARGSSASLDALVRPARMLGFGTALLILGGFGAWSAVAPLASAAIATGVISPDGHRKTVQHLEGGIVRAIHVREGAFVEAGATLLTMEETTARARLDELRDRHIHLLATSARLAAEQAGSSELARAGELASNSKSVAAAVEAQSNLLRSRLASRDAKERILAQKIRQLDEESAGLARLVDAQGVQLDLIGQEIKGVQQLYDKGLERLPRLLALRRSEAEVSGERASNEAKIARNRQQVGETEMQLLTMREQERERIDDEVVKVQAALAEIRSQLPQREDVLTRTAVKAPVSGVVLNVRVTTESGVVAAGQALLDIVPTSAALVIDARLKPTDIDVVRAGLQARVLLTAYRQRNLPLIYGTLRSVSADRLQDERTGEPYFLAKVEVDPGVVARLGDVRLAPGMPADVMILTGERTVISYLLSPLQDSLIRSFREN